MKPKRTESSPRITPAQSLEFLESFRKMQAGIDEPTQLISLRIPANILRAYRLLAQAEDRPYQRMMVQALREYLGKKT